MVTAVPVVDVKAMGRTFVGPPQVVALQPCTFTVSPGEFVAIVGPSGSGKSTLMALLGLMDRPTVGTYHFKGRDVSGIAEHEAAALRSVDVGLVFQSFHLIGYRTVVDNVSLGLAYQGKAKKHIEQLVREAIAQVGLQHRATALCQHLSGGEKQRVAIARAIVKRPSLVLCDEPTGNLDSANTEVILELIAKLNRDGTTVLVVTHDQLVASRCRRLIRMEDGFVAEDVRVGSADAG